MRYLLAAVIVVTCPALAPGQSAQQAVPPPSIGLPLPPIGLPLPVIGLQPPADLRSPVPPPNPPPSGHPPFRPAPTIVFFGAPYGFGVDPAMQSATPGVIAPSPTPPPPAAEPVTGRLRLEIEPEDTAQVFVDGEYVGTPADIGREIELAPGRRQIEIRASGYDTETFDARVAAGRTMTYRQTLNRAGRSGRSGGGNGVGEANALGRAAGAAEVPAVIETSPTGQTRPTSRTRPKTTFYLIPGCYLGNVHPDLVKLPEGCDFSRMITHTPQRSR